MNAPFRPAVQSVREVDLDDQDECARLERFVADHSAGTPFHRPAWIKAVARGTGNQALALILEQADEITAYLPLNLAHSPIFGRALVSSGFAVGGGILAGGSHDSAVLLQALEETALRHSCLAAELRGGIPPLGQPGWRVKSNSHCGFAAELAVDDEAQLNWIPRKQRAEVRKGLAGDLTVSVARSEQAQQEHYEVYAESVRNLGTPVFPKQLFAEVLAAFGDDADILTVHHGGKAVASVLSLYHNGAVMPYWGGGTFAARRLRANDRMYYELMLHARRRGCTVFDFGRSKTESGPYHFKRNWGFEPKPLSYSEWTAPGARPRDVDPTSANNSAKVELWKRLPLPVANLIGPHIARGLA